MKTRNDFHLGLNPNLFSLFTLHCVWLHNIYTHVQAHTKGHVNMAERKKIDNFYRQRKFSVHQWSRACELWMDRIKRKCAEQWGKSSSKRKGNVLAVLCEQWAMSNESTCRKSNFVFFVVFYRHIYDGDRALFSAWFTMWCLILLGIKLNFARKNQATQVHFPLYG